jgi:hypothetical protein
VHLIVLHHGLWGVPMHLDMMRRTLEHKFPEDTVRILNCDKSPAGNTYDGVDVCGDRLVDLVKTTAATENVTKLSLIGYSLGGLIVRYAAGRLYQEGFFDQVQPMNLVTIATPHLGSWRLPQGWMDRTFNRMVPIMTSRTGYQLVMADAHAWGLPLIYLMSHKDLVFYKALQKFKQLMLFANIQFDRCAAVLASEHAHTRMPLACAADAPPCSTRALFICAAQICCWKPCIAASHVFQACLKYHCCVMATVLTVTPDACPAGLSPSAQQP